MNIINYLVRLLAVIVVGGYLAVAFIIMLSIQSLWDWKGAKKEWPEVFEIYSDTYKELMEE
jgi:hypothetical protein